MLTLHLRRFIAACASVLLLICLLAVTQAPAQAGFFFDGSISGKVTGPSNEALKDVRVALYQQDGATWDRIDSTTSFSDPYYEEPGKIGQYEFTNLDPGTYKLSFNERSNGSVEPGLYAIEYFDDATTLEDAVPIVLAPDEHRTGFDAKVEYTGGTISGTVKDAAGVPIEFVDVYGISASRVFAEEQQPIYASSAMRAITDSNGHYTLRTYGQPVKIRFDDLGDYQSEFYDNTVNWEDAAPISASSGESIINVDAELAPTPMVNNSLPRITGPIQVGGTATASTGDWNSSSAMFNYEWFREGRLSPIGTGKTHKITSYSVGKKLTVKVTAHKVGTPDVQATSLPSAAVKRASYITVSGWSPYKGQAKMNVTLKFTGISYPYAKVRISCSLGGQVFKSKIISISRGKGTGTLYSMPKRTWPCKAVFTSTTTVAGDTATTSITVK